MTQRTDRRGRRTAPRTTTVVAVAAAGVLAGASSAGAQAPSPVTFASTGAQQTYVVPAGVGKLRVRAVGADGGAASSGEAGGRGRIIESEVFVTPGQTVYVEVGGDGAANVRGWNGGGDPANVTVLAGGGGGASDVRTVPCGTAAQCATGGTAASLSSRLLVAAGGGGAGSRGGGPGATNGGPGGNAGAAGTAGVRTGTIAGGGGGGAGTATSGGSGGSGEDGSGTSGASGVGGAGGNSGGTGLGGGGGGGLYGGGGGGTGGLFVPADLSGVVSRTGGGGGGGGSSFTPAGATRLTDQVAAATDAPQVRITPMVGFLSREFTVTRTGAGQGTVRSAPAGIDCGTDCNGEFPETTTVTLTATADPDSVFDGWSGDCTGSGTTCTVTVAAVNRVTARFTPRATLAVSTDGPGGGTVSSDPFGVSCPGFSCTRSGKAGDVVTLTATPDQHSVFAGWAGGGCTGTGPCAVTLPAGTTSVRATFLPAVTVTVLPVGAGTGRITSEPAGIDCGATCSQVVGAGTRVTLTATPADGSTFAGFSGAACAGSGTTCTLTVDADTAVAASFGVAPPAPTPVDPGDGGSTPPVTGAGTDPAVPGATPTAPVTPTTPVTPTPPTASATRSGPRLLLGRARTAKASRGRVTTAVRLACAGTAKRCTGTARATTRLRSATGRLRTVLAGRASVSVARGATGTVRLALTAAARRRLASAGRLRLRVTVTTPTAAPGAKRTVAYALTVRR